MSKNTKIVIGLIVLCAVVVLAIGMWANAQRKKQTESAMATVVDARQRSKKGADDTVITLVYGAGAQTGQGKVSDKGVHLERYPRGMQVRICYDPADLSNIRKEDGPCG